MEASSNFASWHQAGQAQTPALKAHTLTQLLRLSLAARAACKSAFAGPWRRQGHQARVGRRWRAGVSGENALVAPPACPLPPVVQCRGLQRSQMAHRQGVDAPAKGTWRTRTGHLTPRWPLHRGQQDLAVAGQQVMDAMAATAPRYHAHRPCVAHMVPECVAPRASTTAEVPSFLLSPLDETPIVPVSPSNFLITSQSPFSQPPTAQPPPTNGTAVETHGSHDPLGLPHTATHAAAS